mmetsp:Transcript_10613/g.25198  ORF Transcript_10613/g.25198 Transcript_10613/m.25198 type:complete len:349 (-) Transcript_10613:276-1322(-)
MSEGPPNKRHQLLAHQGSSAHLITVSSDKRDQVIRLFKYQVLAHPEQERAAKQMVEKDPERFVFHHTKWGKFPDGTDNIEVGGFYPYNNIKNAHVIFLASFHNNDATLSQFHVLNMLCEAFLESLTVILPYYPTGTMERVVREGQVATANTLARLFSNLPRIGKPIRVMVYDLHTLQNRFYLSGNALASLHTAMPLLVAELNKPDSKINCVAFPDEGACKRFTGLISEAFPDWEVVICGKVRDGDKRIVHIQDGNPEGKHIVIVDDLVQTGGTLHECGVALKKQGALSVSAFVTHAVFPRGWDRFSTANGGPFDKFFITNSNPHVTNLLPTDDCFQVLDLVDLMVVDV